MKKILLIIGIVLVILIIAGVIGINSLASVPPTITPQAEISTTTGDVQYKTSAGQWQAAKMGTVLSTGDSIKTGVDGTAELSFYDNARASLAKNTEVEMKHLYIDQYNANHTNVGFTLKVGRVWNRIISLVDENASYEVETSNTVSTVRGTVVDIKVDEAGNEEINVVEHDIEVVMKNHPELKQVVSEKKRTMVDSQKIAKQESPFTTQDMSEEYIKGAWFTGNDKRDGEFDGEMKQVIQKRQDAIMGAQPDTAWYGMKRAAEQVRIATTFDQGQRDTLARQFEERRAVEASFLLDQGKDAKGFQLLQDVINRPDGQPLSSEVKEQVQDALRVRLLDQKDGISPQDIKTFEDKGVLRPHVGEFLKDRAPMRQDQPQGIPPGTPIKPTPVDPKNGVPLPPPTQPIPNQPLPVPITNNPLQPKPPLPPPPATSPVPTQPAPLPPPPTTTTAPTTPPKPLRVQIKAPRTSIGAGESIGLRAGYVMSDGTIQPPNQCQWSMSGDPIGHVGPDGFLSTQKPGGVATIHVNCMRDGQSFSDSIEITALDLDSAIIPFQP